LDDSYPIVKVHGDPYSCGKQHGEQAKKLVQYNVNHYLGLWNRRIGLGREQVLSKASEFVGPIRDFDADLLRELQGLAEGADVSLEEIIALNSRYEVVWSQMIPGKNGCTAMVALPKTTDSGHTLIAQNWDYLVGVKDSCIILEVRAEDKPVVVMHTEAGIIGHKGLNSKGIGLVVNALISDIDRFDPSVPFWILCRKALNSHTLKEALKVILGTEKSVSSNIIIAQAGGAAVDIESTPHDSSIIQPEQGLLVHTNHFIGPRSLSVKDKFVETSPDSIYRYSIARDYLEERVGSISKGSIKEILRNHFGRPYSVCAHEDYSVDEDYRGETLASVIFDLDTREILITKGPPCLATYHPLHFTSLQN